MTLLILLASTAACWTVFSLIYKTVNVHVEYSPAVTAEDNRLCAPASSAHECLKQLGYTLSWVPNKESK
jgi:hypothetical protein